MAAAIVRSIVTTKRTSEVRFGSDSECAEGVDHKEWSQEYYMHLCDILLLGSARAGRQACPVDPVSPASLPGQQARSAQPGPAGLARPGRLIVGRLPALVVDRNPAR